MAQRAKLTAWIGGLALVAMCQAVQVPPIVGLAATGSALLWVLGILLLARRDREWAPMMAALLVGAVVAALPASHLNQVLLDWLARVAGDDLARRVVPASVAPLVEEIAKAVALGLSLLVIPGRRLTVALGLGCGALVGVGFAWMENLQYLTFAVIQGGTATLWQAVYLRGILGGLHHAAFAAATGVGLAWADRSARTSRRCLAVGVGLSAAIVQHLIWNAVVAGRITAALCGAEPAGGPCRSSPDLTVLFVTTPFLALLSLVPGMLALFLIVASNGRKAARQC